MRASSMVLESRLVQISAWASSLQPTKAALVDQEPPDPIEQVEHSLLKLLVERLTGREIKLMRPSEVKEVPTEAKIADAPAKEHGPRAEGESRQGWGLVYDHYESHYESESTSFSARGVVHTADGREINIGVELNMSREFFSEQQLSLRAGDALKDPLVVNFSGSAAELTERNFSFDIDADGRSDQIAFVGPGSGFLALDKNGDGEINDGSELFGPETGNGFADLAVHDEDGNDWIDESDSIYDRLRVWSKDSDGNDQLVALGQRGVGAIYLGHIDTPFLLKDADNDTLGAVRDSGIFLEEDGGVGT
ncbi:MAG: hypothetical protein GY753_18095, partial [Gammaproteobacteria bacterium]|nr:hypothetical protein [Gammaproteobacteria bacterium]